MDKHEDGRIIFKNAEELAEYVKECNSNDDEIVFNDNDELIDYAKDLVELLDGRGMTITDYDMLYEAIEHYA